MRKLNWGVWGVLITQANPGEDSQRTQTSNLPTYSAHRTSKSLAWRWASNYMKLCFHLENTGNNSVQITGFRSLHIFRSQQAKIILLISLAWKRTKWFVLLMVAPPPKLEHGHLLLNLLLYGREKVRPNFKNPAFKDQLRWNECFYRQHCFTAIPGVLIERLNGFIAI